MQTRIFSFPTPVPVRKEGNQDGFQKYKFNRQFTTLEQRIDEFKKMLSVNIGESKTQEKLVLDIVTKDIVQIVRSHFWSLGKTLKAITDYYDTNLNLVLSKYRSIPHVSSEVAKIINQAFGDLQDLKKYLKI